MSNSWDQYFSHYSDWDEAHCFNVRLELKFEDNIKSLGYQEFFISDDVNILFKNFLLIIDFFIREFSTISTPMPNVFITI